MTKPKPADAPKAKVKAPALCETCHGTGRISDKESCPVCLGTGKAQ